MAEPNLGPVMRTAPRHAARVKDFSIHPVAVGYCACGHDPNVAAPVYPTENSHDPNFLHLATLCCGSFLFQ